MRKVLGGVFLLALAVGCPHNPPGTGGDSGVTDAGPPPGSDGGQATDSGQTADGGAPPDAGSPGDSGTPTDGGSPDGGNADAGPADGGVLAGPIYWGALSSGGSFGAEVQTNAAFTNFGILGDSTPPSADGTVQQTNASFIHIGGFMAAQH